LLLLLFGILCMFAIAVVWYFCIFVIVIVWYFV
jgi:hypothetical protein